MLKIKNLLCVLISLIFLSANAQELDWLKSSTSDDVFTSHSFYTSTKHDGYFYHAGDFWKDLTIDNFHIDILGDNGNGFIIQMDETGLTSGLWALQSENYVRINKIEANPVSGTIIATGNFRNNLVFDDQEWTAPFYSNGFIMSIRPDGTLDWIQEMVPQDETSFAFGEGLAIDEFGDIYVAIESRGSVEIDDTIFDLEGESGALFVKMNKDGDVMNSQMWKNLSYEGFTDILDIAVDEDNHLIIGGGISGAIEIADSLYLFPEDAVQSFLIKEDDNLNMLWFKRYNGVGGSSVLDIHADGKDLVLSLQYNTSIDIDGTILDGTGSWGETAIVYLDENANLQWVRNITLTEFSGTSGVYGFSICEWLDQYYIAGMYQNDVVIDGEIILDNTSSGASYQYPFILSLDKEGELTSAYDFVGSNEPGKIKTLSANNSHLTFGGDFSGQVSIEGSSVSTINSALFYGALKTEATSIEIVNPSNDYFSIYPTVTADFLNIEMEKQLDGLSLISVDGSVLKTLSGETQMLDISDLAAGVYFINGIDKGVPFYAKFVKQ